MFLEVDNNLIQISDILRVYTNDIGVTIILIRGIDPIRILDSDRSKYKKIVEAIKDKGTVVQIY